MTGIEPFRHALFDVARCVDRKHERDGRESLSVVEEVGRGEKLTTLGDVDARFVFVIPGSVPPLHLRACRIHTVLAKDFQNVPDGQNANIGTGLVDTAV